MNITIIISCIKGETNICLLLWAQPLVLGFYLIINNLYYYRYFL